MITAQCQYMNPAVQPREGLPVAVRAGVRARARGGGGVHGAAAGAGAGHPLHPWRAPAAPSPQAQGRDHLPTITRPYMYLLSAGSLRGRVRGHEPHAAPLAAVRREAAVRPGHAARTQAGAGRHQPVLPRHVQR